MTWFKECFFASSALTGLLFTSCQLSTSPTAPPTSSGKPTTSTVSSTILDQDFSVQQLGYRVAMQYVWPNVRNLKEHSDFFESALTNHCESLSAHPDGSPDLNDGKLMLLKNQFRQLIAAYSAVVSVPIGPVTTNNNEFMVNTHSYPFLNTCGIDRNVANVAAGLSPGRILSTQKGLSSFDYLLFNNDLNHTCNSQIQPPLIEWNQKTASAKKAQRCEWAKNLFVEFKSNVTNLYNQWNPAEGNYTQTLLSAEIFRSDKEFLELLLLSLFNIEAIKDNRLGNPLGVYGDCRSDINACPQYIEFPYSDLGLDAIESRIKSLSFLLFGSPFPVSNSKGFTAVLKDSQFLDLHQKILTHLSKASQALQKLKASGSFSRHRNASLEAGRCSTANSSDLESICGLYGEISALARLIKSDVILALSLRTPPQHQGDND